METVNEKINQAPYSGTALVIPTRNRAAIAMNAIRSVLDQPVANLSVMVSDNSTSLSERDQLQAFCASIGDPRLRYIRSPGALSMSLHWQWAIEQALEFYTATHFIYLTDRMMFRAGSLGPVLEIARTYPQKVITYNHDRIKDTATPIRVEEYPASGKLLEVQTEHLSQMYSEVLLHNALPRMLNCIVPRSLFERMKQRFGNVFCSISPDFVFCCRCLDMEDSILFYDKSPLFHYALNRSNGASVTRGEMTPDNADFTANLPVDNSIRNYATPIPELITAVNAVMNEYLLYKHETNSPRFYDLNVENYLQENASEIEEVVDPVLRKQMLTLLIKNGYKAPRTDLVGRLVGAVNRNWHPASGWRKATSLLAAAMRAGWRVVRPPGEEQLSGTRFVNFYDLEEAINYARYVSQGNLKQSLLHTNLLQAREMPSADLSLDPSPEFEAQQLARQTVASGC